MNIFTRIGLTRLIKHLAGTITLHDALHTVEHFFWDTVGECLTGPEQPVLELAIAYGEGWRSSSATIECEVHELMLEGIIWDANYFDEERDLVPLCAIRDRRDQYTGEIEYYAVTGYRTALFPEDY